MQHQVAVVTGQGPALAVHVDLKVLLQLHYDPDKNIFNPKNIFRKILG